MQRHHKETSSPKYDPKDALTYSHWNTPPQCVNIYGFSLVNEIPFLQTKSKKIDFKSVQ